MILAIWSFEALLYMKVIIVRPECAFPFAIVYVMYPNIASNLYGKQIKFGEWLVFMNDIHLWTF